MKYYASSTERTTSKDNSDEPTTTRTRNRKGKLTLHTETADLRSTCIQLVIVSNYTHLDT